MQELGGIRLIQIILFLQWIVQILYHKRCVQEELRCQVIRIETRVGGLRMAGKLERENTIIQMKHGVIVGRLLIV